MDIGSTNKGVAGRLSNFTPRSFVFDGVQCNSMEGLLQSLKFVNPDIQASVCKLVGISAKRRGSKKNRTWKQLQTLWWNGVPYKRKSVEYWNLLLSAFVALSKNEKFRSDLLKTGDAVFRHSIGRNKKSETVLTEQEFCRLLTIVRDGCRKGYDHVDQYISIYKNRKKESDVVMTNNFIGFSEGDV